MNCAEGLVATASYVCIAFDGRLPRFWRYHVTTGHLKAVGQARGRFFPRAQEAGVSLEAMRAGWPALVDLESRTATACQFPDHRGGVAGYDFTDELLAVSKIDGDETVVTLYRLPDTPPARRTRAFNTR